MSLSIQVFLHRQRMPSAKGWAGAIAAAGFDTRMDTDFDPLTHSGYLPCPDELSGFDLYVEPFSERSFEFDAASREVIGGRDLMVTLRFSGRDADLAAAMAAAASLAVLCDGVVYEHEPGRFVAADAAMAWARNEPYEPLLIQRRRSLPGKLRIRPATVLRLLFILALAALVYIYTR